MVLDKSGKQADRHACRQAGPRQTGRKEERQAASLVSIAAVAANFRFISKHHTLPYQGLEMITFIIYNP